MEDNPQPLSYARPVENRYRPPMYSLVMTVIIASGLILLGILASVVFVAVLLERDGRVFALIPLGVAAVLFYIGIRCMIVSIRFLLGKPVLDPNWERWLFWVWITRM